MPSTVNTMPSTMPQVANGLRSPAAFDIRFAMIEITRPAGGNANAKIRPTMPMICAMGFAIGRTGSPPGAPRRAHGGAGRWHARVDGLAVQHRHACES